MTLNATGQTLKPVESLTPAQRLMPADAGQGRESCKPFLKCNQKVLTRRDSLMTASRSSEPEKSPTARAVTRTCMAKRMLLAPGSQQRQDPMTVPDPLQRLNATITGSRASVAA